MIGSVRHDALDAAAPAFSEAEAAHGALQAFGLTGHCRRLAGERDLNFCLTEPGGRRHLFKIWNRNQSQDVIDLQLQALRHIARTHAALPVPRIEATPDGELLATVQDANGAAHAAVLLSWLDGVPLRQVPANDVLKQRLGATLAQLDRALDSFQHPAQQRDLIWDVSRADRLGNLSDGVEDPDVRKVVDATLDGFETTTRPVLRQLRQQVIHGDFNPDNVLVTAARSVEVSGILDFGDSLRAPRICDLAIAAAYQLDPGPEPLVGALPLIRAYHGVLPLDAAEQAALPMLIRCRLLGTVIITSHLARLHPANREYLLVDTAAAADRLLRLAKHPLEADSAHIERCLRP